MLITGDAEVASHAVISGVDRIFVDMEVIGKAERQGHLDTHKAAHTWADLERVRAAVSSEIMVRLNPMHDGTSAEVEGALARGANRLMLPMYRTVDEVLAFRSLVAHRCPITWLAETPHAIVRLPAYVQLLEEGDEVYFGLNDLSLAMGLDFLFEVVAGRLLDGPARFLRGRGVSFGFGGIGRIGLDGRAPTELVLSEHVRLGSSAVILSRSFHGGATTLAEMMSNVRLDQAVRQLRHAEARLKACSPAELDENARRLASRVFERREPR